MADARRVRIKGRVQGVFFRAWTKEQAEQLGVLGWVRNCSDGSVEAHLEGDSEKVSELIGRLRAGPPAANVSSVEIQDVDPEDFHHFAVALSF
jgi:acylphosphatase